MRSVPVFTPAASAIAALVLLAAAQPATAARRAAAPAAACADAAACAGDVVVRIDRADLATPGQRAEVRRRLEAAADAYCRANPMEATPVAACRRALTAELIRDLAARTGVALDGTRATQLAHN